MPRVVVIELRVRYAETDQMGVVYHANYLAWCELGRTEYLRALGTTYRDLELSGVALAVSEAELRYHAPARYDDLVSVSTTLTNVRSRSITFEYLVSKAEGGRRLVSARTTLVAMGAGGRTISLPPGVRALLQDDTRE